MTDAIDRLARLLAKATGRRAVVVGVVAGVLGARADRARADQCNAANCTGCCHAWGHCVPDPAAVGLSGLNGGYCRACRKGRRRRADGTCGRRPRNRR